MASGIMIGFALGIGGIGVMVTGLIADGFGLFTALNILSMVLVVAAIMTKFVPSATRDSSESVTKVV
jgi:FSR family fosmidomycin resistance protein-like MFS transporter